MGSLNIPIKIPNILIKILKKSHSVKMLILLL